MLKFSLLFLCILFPLQSVEIALWHAFDGPLEETFVALIEEFNQKTAGIHVSPVQKGNYTEVYEKGLQAFAQGQHPHILQIYEVATLSAMGMPHVFRPVDQFMQVPENPYIEVIQQFYTSPEGKMLSLPWNASTGVLFYNQELFEKEGLSPPRTWEELEEIGARFAAKGIIGFTTAWPAAYHLEHLLCWHNIPFGTERNGLGGPSARFVFNGPEAVMHWTKLIEWQKRGIFSYQGRFLKAPETLFSEGKCAMLMQGSNRLPLLQRSASFAIGASQLPFWKRVTASPYTLNIGGASLWVFQGLTDEEYAAIAQFFAFLSSEHVQVQWHQKTGYLPITQGVYEISKRDGFYATNPAAEAAVLEVIGRPPGEFSLGLRFGNYTPIREIIIDCLEKALAGELSPKQALDEAVREGNRHLADFEQRIGL